MNAIHHNPVSSIESSLKRFPNKLALGAVTVSMPVGYLVYKHVSWMETPEAKKRMLTHQLTFWSGMAAMITLLHGAFFGYIPFIKKELLGGARVAMALLGGLIGASGFEGGLRLSNKLSPHQNHSVSINQKNLEQKPPSGLTSRQEGLNPRPLSLNV